MGSEMCIRDRPNLMLSMDLTALQRQLKAIGIFARLQLRDSKSSHLRHIQPTLESAIELSGKYPQTRTLAPYLRSLQDLATTKLHSLGQPTS